jgi:hypothetical protein
MRQPGDPVFTRHTSRLGITRSEKGALRSSQDGSRGLFAWCKSVLVNLNAVQAVAFLGLFWLLAYTFTDWAREATLALVWQLELWVAEVLGVSLRPLSAAPAPNEPALWAAILGAYCLASLLLVTRSGHAMPSEEDLLGAEEAHAAGWPTDRGGR